MFPEGYLPFALPRHRARGPAAREGTRAHTRAPRQPITPSSPSAPLHFLLSNAAVDPPIPPSSGGPKQAWQLPGNLANAKRTSYRTGCHHGRTALPFCPFHPILQTVIRRGVGEEEGQRQQAPLEETREKEQAGRQPRPYCSVFPEPGADKPLPRRGIPARAVAAALETQHSPSAFAFGEAVLSVADTPAQHPMDPSRLRSHPRAHQVGTAGAPGARGARSQAPLRRCPKGRGSAGQSGRRA